VKKVFKEISSLREFKRDLKKLRRFRTLKDDLDVFIEKQLQLYHKLGIDNKGIVQISNLGIKYPKIFKARKFACRSLKGKGSASGIRVIYAYFEEEDCVEFIEIYYKGDKENEDRDRILEYYSSTD
jgi:hypothetical protein